MSKRKFEETLVEEVQPPIKATPLKNSLDSDEEDDEAEEENYNVMNEDEFEGM